MQRNRINNEIIPLLHKLLIYSAANNYENILELFMTPYPLELDEEKVMIFGLDSAFDALENQRNVLLAQYLREWKLWIEHSVLYHFLERDLVNIFAESGLNMSIQYLKTEKIKHDIILKLNKFIPEFIKSSIRVELQYYNVNIMRLLDFENEDSNLIVNHYTLRLIESVNENLSHIFKDVEESNLKRKIEDEKYKLFKLQLEAKKSCKNILNKIVEIKNKINELKSYRHYKAILVGRLSTGEFSYIEEVFSGLLTFNGLNNLFRDCSLSINDIFDEERNSLLSVAIKNRADRSIRKLIQLGANSLQENNEKKSALDVLVDQVDKEITRGDFLSLLGMIFKVEEGKNHEEVSNILRRELYGYIKLSSERVGTAWEMLRKFTKYDFFNERVNAVLKIFKLLNSSNKESEFQEIKMVMADLSQSCTMLGSSNLLIMLSGWQKKIRDFSASNIDLPLNKDDKIVVDFGCLKFFKSNNKKGKNISNIGENFKISNNL